MKKNIINIFLVVIFSFIFLINVNAECSYQERKELLEKAKKIEAFFEPDVDSSRFIFKLFNLDDDLYVHLENLNTNQSVEIYKYQYDTEFYTKDESNVSNIVTYKLQIYSNKSECYGDQIISKTIKKGIINKFYYEDICKGIDDYVYCSPVLTKKINISDEEVYKRIKAYKDSISYEEKTIIDDKFSMDDLLEIIKNYWYILFIILLIIASIFVKRYINKKRGEL